MLTNEQRADFARDGILKLAGAFSETDAARMRGVLWRELANRHGILEHDRSTWTIERPFGLKSTKKSRAFDPILGDMVRGALDDLFGHRRWIEPKHMGQVLVTMPGTASWRVPLDSWHSDFETEHGDDLFAVKWWALFGETLPEGGGTPQLAGSHKLFQRHLSSLQNREYKHARDSFMRSHPWLKAIGDAKVDDEVDIDGLPARVIELTGKPGDVFLTHAWVFHTLAVNANPEPRMMRSMGIRRQS